MTQISKLEDDLENVQMEKAIVQAVHASDIESGGADSDSSISSDDDATDTRGMTEKEASDIMMMAPKIPAARIKSKVTPMDVTRPTIVIARSVETVEVRIIHLTRDREHAQQSPKNGQDAQFVATSCVVVKRSFNRVGLLL